MHQMGLEFNDDIRECPYVERPDRLVQFARILDRAGCWLTVRHVAQLAGMRKSYHVQGLLDELVETGLAERTTMNTGRPIPSRCYRIASGEEGHWSHP